MNVYSLLSTYGVAKGGALNMNAPLVQNVNDSDEFGAYKIEGDLDNIDTSEEFITAAYFSPVKIENIGVLEKILPHNATGLKELHFMWKMKSQAMNYVPFASATAKQSQIGRYATTEHNLLVKAGMTDADGVKLFNDTIPNEVARMLRDKLNTVELGVNAVGGGTRLIQITRLEDSTYEVRQMADSGWMEPKAIKTLSPADLSSIGYVLKPGSQVEFPLDKMLVLQFNLLVTMISNFFINNEEKDFINLAAIGNIYNSHTVENTSNILWYTEYTKILNQINPKFADAVASKNNSYPLHQKFATLPAYVQSTNGRLIPFEEVLCVSSSGGGAWAQSDFMTLDKANTLCKKFPYQEMLVSLKNEKDAKVIAATNR